MKLELKGLFGELVVATFWALIILCFVSIGYGFYYLRSPHQEAQPKIIHLQAMLIILNDPYVSEINITGSTTDVFSAFNPFNLTLHVKLNNTQDISKAYLILTPISLNTSLINSNAAVQKFITAALSAGTGFNLTSILKSYSPAVTNIHSIRATAIFSVSSEGQFTLFVVTLLSNGLFYMGKPEQTLLNIQPYSSYLQAESIHETVRSTITEIWLSYIMLGFTLVVSAFTLSQVIEVKSKIHRRNVIIVLTILLVTLMVIWAIFIM
jgi:hypothetical protein